MSGITKLNVLYVGWGERWLLGTLAQAGRDLVFEYSSQAIERGIETDFQISPLQAPISNVNLTSNANLRSNFKGPAHSHGLPGFIADALPDGWGMLLMDRAFRQAGREPASISVLERLAVVGRSAMGALAFEPVHAIEAAQIEKISLAKLAKEMQSVLADSEGENPEESPQEQLRRLLLLGGSPQGARPKALLRWSESKNQFFSEAAANLPSDAQPWMVKFPAQGEKAEVCALEEFYARIARAGGIDMPQSRFIPLDKAGKHAAFAVRRFDRALTAHGEVRVPMQSLAAMLNADYRLPSLDYETVLLATQRITGDYRETLKAFERCVFNVLTHNRDDHAKNFAYVMGQDNRWRLSPAFDLTFSFGPGGEHSTSVAGEGKLPTRAHLLRVAARGGVKEKDASVLISHWKEALQPKKSLMRDLEIKKSSAERIFKSLAIVWNQI